MCVKPLRPAPPCRIQLCISRTLAVRWSVGEVIVVCTWNLDFDHSRVVRRARLHHFHSDSLVVSFFCGR